MIDEHLIPPMTHPLARYWDQPDRCQILVDAEYALMSPTVFAALPQYDCSDPTGVYEGKMWKRVLSTGKTFLLWYGKGLIPDTCSVNHRRILLVGDDSPVVTAGFIDQPNDVEKTR